jgi:hypothetical protein
MRETLNRSFVGQLRTTADSVNHESDVITRLHRFKDGKRQTDFRP